LLVWPDEPADWKNVDEWPNAESRDAVWRIFERISKLTEAEVLKLGALKGAYDKVPFLRFDEEAAAGFLDWRRGLERRLRGDELSPALEGHLAKYRKLVPGLALIDHVAEGGTGNVGAEALARALDMAEYLETHARRVYGATDTVDVISAEAILAHIRRGDLKDGFTAREVHQRDWSRLTDHDHLATRARSPGRVRPLGYRHIRRETRLWRATEGYLSHQPGLEELSHGRSTPREA